ncbi:MAG: hypothetical protein WKG01_15070 [Kofleriaceae bacterium]
MSWRALGVTALVALGAPRPAAADANDLVMARLTEAVETADGTRYIPQNAELRALASQLGVVMAPHLLTPADTLGFAGFQLTADFTTTTVDTGERYWRVLDGTRDPAGTGGASHGDGMMRTIGMFVRKGMWFPVPSFEVGAGAVHLVDSQIWTGQLYTKLALHEGYHQLPIPSVAVRGGVSRMMQQRELDLTVASLDLTVSKHFGVGGTWRLDPYAGWNILVIIPRSEVIDPTPHIDPLSPGNEMDAGNSFVFKDQDNIYRQRFLVGVKAQFYVVQLTLEAVFALKGTSIDDRTGTSDQCMPNSSTTVCDSKDLAASQRTLSLSVGLDF